MTVNEVINRATDSINNILESTSKSDLYCTESQLIEIRNNLNQLVEPDSSRNDWLRPFCRQLNRLMDYNDPLSTKFWGKLRDYISNVLDGINVKQGACSNSNNIPISMELEGKLEQRELQFQKIYGEQKNLKQLFFEHKEFLKEYLQKCISLHSEVQVRGLIDNLDTFLFNGYGLTEVSVSPEKLQRVKQKLKCIEIPLNYSNRLLQYIDTLYSKSTDLYREVNNSLSNFLPSVERRSFDGYILKTFEEVLQSERWFVILGDPGSAKTSLLRWIMYVFAGAAHRGDEEIVLEENRRSAVRIPVLIRIGEFASWLEQHQNETLIDYIGKHTWFSEPCIRDDGGSVLKELIYHGHALILLDGLDDIPEHGRRGEIGELVRKFIDEYVRAPNFISAFDSRIFDTGRSLFPELLETQPPRKSGGNQIIITSRIVGYHLYPLDGSFVQHYSLLLMDDEKAKEFVTKLMLQLEKSVLDVFSSERIKFSGEIVRSLSNKRHSCVEAMFTKGSKLLFSNHSLLTLICMFIFQSPDEFYPKSRVKVYKYVVQSVLRSWINYDESISEALTTNFLIDLACYLHLQSPSGLIDAFDMKNLCCTSLHQQGLPDNRMQLRNYAKKLICLLDANDGVIAERGLHVFGFLHLSFQDYFVSQSLVKVSSIEDAVRRILTFITNSRFRESLLLALGWISWEWSFDDYDRFCNLLVTSTEDYAIPFGSLLFFDALNDIQRFPSKSVIFAALNELLDHAFIMIAKTYLIPNLFKLNEDIIIEWMQLHLGDDKRLSKFCQCLLFQFDYNFSDFSRISKSISPVFYQQLWSFHNINISAEFIIDQTLRRTMASKKASDDIFNKELSSYLLSHNIGASNIHPLILSVIIAVCSGIDVKSDETRTDIGFSAQRMHRESSVIAPIVEYLVNHKESHSTKVQTLIKHYEMALEESEPNNNSIDIVDTLISLFCLQGPLKTLIYEKYKGHQALSLALDRIKRAWFYLNKSLESLSFHRDYSDFSQVDNNIKINPMTQSIYPIQIFQQKPYFLLIFVPQHLRELYCNTIIAPIHNTDALPLVVLLSQCLMHLEDVDKNDFSFYLTLSILQPYFKNHMFDNYASVLFWENVSTTKLENNTRKEFLNAMKDRMAADQPKDWEILINMEYQRISEAKKTVQNQDKDLRLFAASISLARLFQAQYRLRKERIEKDMNLLTVESNELQFAIRNIHDPILRIIALSIILNMADPLILGKKQRNKLRWEMIFLLQSSLEGLSLLTSTLLFLQCYMAHQFFPLTFQYMTNVIGKKLNQTSINNESQSQRTAYIALRRIKNSNLSPYLSEFEKQTKNLSDLLQFNSGIFFRYFTNTTSFDSSNTILLSLMYLGELAFDVQVLQMDTTNNMKSKISPVRELKQLWNDSSKNGKLMTCKVAEWITNYLQIWKKEELHQIIEDVSRCSTIETTAVLVIEKWLSYRMDRDLRFFAHYAALQLFLEGSHIKDLIDIITEMFDIDKDFHLSCLTERMFNPGVVNLTDLRQILVSLHRNIRYSSKINVCIDRKDIFDLILNLELERVLSNVDESFGFLTKPFLLMIKGCSHDLRLHFLEYLRTFIKERSDIQNTSKDEYVAVLIKWIIESSSWSDKGVYFSQELYDYSFTLLRDKRFPQANKGIINALNSLYIYSSINKENVFLQDDAIINLENVILSWDSYQKDIIDVCLLAYGNCLLNLEDFQMSRNVSHEVQNVLTNLFRTASSKITSIRAAFCIVLAQYSRVTSRTILDCLKNKWDLTPENSYNILSQKALYTLKYEESFNEGEISDYLETYSTELLDTFVLDLYSCLYNRCRNNYLSDPAPNYINIAEQFSERNFNLFQKAIQKSSFGEEKFKRELCHSLQHAKEELDCVYIARLYSRFNVLTVEYIEMAACIDNVGENEIWDFVADIKQVWGREVIENLFQKLYFVGYTTEFELDLDVLQLLIRLAKADVVSFLEVHRRVSLVISSLSHDINSIDQHLQRNICEILLDSSCIEQMDLPSGEAQLLTESEAQLFTESDIDKEFERQIQDLIKTSALFLRRNNLSNINRSLSSGSD